MKLEIHLQEGFTGRDEIEIRVNGKAVYQGKPKTRMQTGLAHLFECDAPEKAIELKVSMPGLGLHETFPIAPSLSRQVGLSLDETGKLKLKTSAEPFGYV